VSTDCASRIGCGNRLGPGVPRTVSGRCPSRLRCRRAAAATDDGLVRSEKMWSGPNIWRGRELAVRLPHDERLSGILSTEVIPVQRTLFVKSIESNWLVSLHQDLSIPVAERVESPGCQGWSEKDDELFVQPPVSVLDSVLALRLHLDDCKERNGALRVVPGSHRLGRLTTAEAVRAKDELGEVCVEIPRGGAILMKPLLLHASSKVSIDNMRRVLHFVFARRPALAATRPVPCLDVLMGAAGSSKHTWAKWVAVWNSPA
jgi:hypothetical protein